MSTCRWYSAAALETLRQAGPGQRVEDRQPVGPQARIEALPEGGRRAEREQVWQEVAHLVHQVDAQLLVLDADVDMHSTNQQPARRRLHFCRQVLIALQPSVMLLGPVAERMGRCRDRAQAFPTRRLDHDPTQPRQVLAGLLDRPANAGTDLDLRTQQLG